jgi:hypothetical protein
VDGSNLGAKGDPVGVVDRSVARELKPLTHAGSLSRLAAREAEEPAATTSKEVVAGGWREGEGEKKMEGECGRGK